ELHDVAFVHQRDALEAQLHGVADRAVDQPLRAQVADGFESYAHLDGGLALRRANPFELRLPLRGGFRAAEPDFLELLREFPGEEVENLLRLRRAGSVL